MTDKCLVSYFYFLKPFCADYASERLETVPIFSPDTHSPDNISQFTSNLKLLLVPEVKYGERFLPVGEKSFVFGSS